ncbi:MAG: hypothetical protein HY247_04785 [archaeon]|nr:MAG: hypothetical protein HY247_04785 [archaeon]
MIDKRRRILQAFSSFLSDYVRDLNHLSEDGWAVLVEGKRDESALRELGFKGRLLTVSSFGRGAAEALSGSKKVAILTDLDREGGVLASKFIKKLAQEGVKTSLAERRRLQVATRGVFLHIENLSRFAESEA